MNGMAIADRIFEVAYFWRLDPARAMALPLSRFALYETQAERIAQLMVPDSHGR